MEKNFSLVVEDEFMLTNQDAKLRAGSFTNITDGERFYVSWKLEMVDIQREKCEETTSVNSIRTS